ncbi:MAG: M55 family metallopeptidase [Gemmatimonadetes bacterium]|nr:M55 family metallopeptidase [Gemmatimonadota bacterium]
MAPVLARCRLLVALLLTPLALAAQRPLKVFISVDMEGIAGVVTADQLNPAGFEYERFRGFMTAELLAAIDGARAAGATAIVVADAHGNGENILIERLPDDVMIVRSWPRPLGMMQGIDSSFAAAVFIGYHAATTTPAGVRAHTFSSATLASVSLNGTPIPEAVMGAAIAGYYGVPVVAISGDNIAVNEAQALIGPMEGAIVKQAISFHSALTMTPAAAQALIRARVQAGVARRQALKPYVLATPVRLDVTFKNYRPSEVLSYLSIVTRTGSHSIRFTGRDIIEVSKFLEFMGDYQADLAP